MKRVVRNKSGKASYGPKWQNKNTESSSDSDNNDDLHSPTTGIESAEQSPTIRTARGDRDDHDQIPIAPPRIEKMAKVSKDGELMYRAALTGDWVAAEVLLDRDPNLAVDYVTEEGGRALHVAAAMKRVEFVKKLVEHISEDKLALVDGRGHTACCYAVISGEVKIARVLVKKNRKVVTAPDEEKVTPLYKAALRGDSEMLPYLLRSTESEDLSEEEWFDLLLAAIKGRMYGIAIKILGKDRSIAKLANKEGTALHLLAQRKPKPTSLQLQKHNYIRVEEDLRELQKILWDEMQNLEKDRLLEVIRKPHLLHDATKDGNVQLVTMIIRSYPQLIWDTDSHGYDISHISVIHRQCEVFNLINQVQPTMVFRSIFQDQEGNNILHLAAKLPALTKRELPSALQMQSELLWFEMVENMSPPSCVMMRNKKGLTPGELFSNEHKRLLEDSETWMRNTAGSYVLIATILLTVVFAAVFTVPGGYGAQTGEPVLAKKHWFKLFVVFEVVGFTGAVVSIIAFRSIMASRFAEEDFMSALPNTQLVGFYALLLSLVGAFSAFMSSIALYNLQMNGVVWFGFCTLYLVGAIWVVVEFGATYQDVILKDSSRRTNYTIFEPPRMIELPYFMAKTCVRR